MAEVRLDRVTKRFGDTVAVNAVDLVVHDGEFLSLLGPSGCGKSTLLNTIAGLLDLSSGGIYVDETRVDGVAPKDRGMAMVFQDYALYPHMTVAENLAFPLQAQRMPTEQIRQTVADTATTLGIEPLLTRTPKQLSGGQRQRVALGRAIVRHPKVFLMDEPLSNLDARLRIHMRKELRLLHRRLRATTIYVTHDQTEAMTLSDRVAVMRNGVLQQVDTPLSIYEHPKNMFVAGFMGHVPMNFLECRLESARGGFAFTSDSFTYFLLGTQSDPLGNFVGKQVVLGVRSEHIDVCTQDDANALPVTVELLEQMGSDLYVYARLGDEGIVIRTPPTFGTEPGDVLRVRFRDDAVRVFDRGTEEVIELATLPSRPAEMAHAGAVI